jgi:hypothetical protein
MKNVNTRLFFFSTLLIAFGIANAQVSITATGGTTGPTSYLSLKDAFDAINAGTHKNNITVTIISSTTETASAILNASSTGASSYTSILVKPARDVSPVIFGSLGNSLVILDGTANVTFDGSNTTAGTTKNLTLANPNGSTMTLQNGATGNLIKNLVIQSGISYSGAVVMGTSLAGEGNNNNRIENNDITRTANQAPHMGILNIGTSGKPNTGNIYRNNRVFDFSYFGFSDGDENDVGGFSNNTLVEGNEFFCTNAIAPNLIGVFINNPVISNMHISKNKIHSLAVNGIGVGITAIMLYEAGSVTVSNNMIALSDPLSEIMGIAQETDAGALIKIYNNTVSIYGTTTGTKRSFAFFKNFYSTGDDIRDNHFINTRISSGTGKQYDFIKFNSGSYTSNYNNLVSTGNANNYIGGESNTTTPALYATFAEWKTGTGQDINSISVNPVFLSSTDLHITAASSPLLYNKGIPVGITTDIDGDSRDAATPDIGADEFTFSVTAVPLTNTDEFRAVLWPNIVYNNALLRIHAKRPMKIDWEITDCSGRLVKVVHSELTAGDQDLSLNLSGLATGAHQLMGKTPDGKMKVIRFVKR